MTCKGRFRRVVERRGRRYVICGLRRRPPVRPDRSHVWLPGGTLVLALILGAYAIGRPPIQPFSQNVAHGPTARYTIDDFAFAPR